jgi:hypothetical protein
MQEKNCSKANIKSIILSEICSFAGYLLENQKVIWHNAHEWWCYSHNINSMKYKVHEKEHLIQGCGKLPNTDFCNSTESDLLYASQ